MSFTGNVSMNIPYHFGLGESKQIKRWITSSNSLPQNNLKYHHLNYQ